MKHRLLGLVCLIVGHRWRLAKLNLWQDGAGALGGQMVESCQRCCVRRWQNINGEIPRRA